MNLKTFEPSLYDSDYQLWLDRTLEQLRLGEFEQLDLDNLIEELDSLGKSEKRAILSYLMRLCEHLLKLSYWDAERERYRRAWKLEIRNFRLQIRALLQDSPSLLNHLRANFVACYQNVGKLFLDGSELDAAQVPVQPCFTLEQALDEDWLPIA